MATTLLAIDPGRSFKGEKTIGLSWFSEEEVGETGRLRWEERWRRSVSFEYLVKNLNISENRDFNDWTVTSTWLLFFDHIVEEVVIEDFVNNTKSRGGQRNGTSECIGAVEYACIKAGVPFTRQKPDTLIPAKLHAGYVDTHKHLPHQDAAYLHGFEYLVRKGRLTPVGLEATL